MQVYDYNKYTWNYGIGPNGKYRTLYYKESEG